MNHPSRPEGAPPPPEEWSDIRDQFRDAWTSGDLMLQILNAEPPRLRSIAPKTPRDLEVICGMCLEKAPERRYPSCQHLADELRRWLDDRPIEARPAGQAERFWRACKRNPAVAARGALAVLLLVSGTIVSSYFSWDARQQQGLMLIKAEEAERNAREAEQNARRATAEAQRADAQSEEARRNAEEAERQREVALESEADRRKQLARQDVRTGMELAEQGEVYRALLWLVEALRLDEDGPVAERFHRLRISALLNRYPSLRHMWFGVQHTAFSPMRSEIAMTSDSEVTVRAMSGEALCRMTGPASLMSLSFSPDGNQLATVTDGGVQLWDARTGEPRMPNLPLEGKVRSLAFDSKSERVAVTHGYKTTLIDTVNDEPIGEIASGARVVECFGFSDDSKNVAVMASHGGKYELFFFDAITGDPVPRPEPITELASELEHSHPNGPLPFWLDAQRVMLSDTQQVRGVDVQTGTEILPPISWKRPDGRFTQRLTPDQSAMVTYSDGRLTRWSAGERLDLPSKHEGLGTFAGNTGQSGSARWSNLMATTGMDDVGWIWDVPGCQPASAPIWHNNGVYFFNFDPHTNRLASSGNNLGALVWDLDDSLADDRNSVRRPNRALLIPLAPRWPTPCSIPTAAAC